MKVSFKPLKGNHNRSKVYSWAFQNKHAVRTGFIRRPQTDWEANHSPQIGFFFFPQSEGLIFAGGEPVQPWKHSKHPEMENVSVVKIRKLEGGAAPGTFTCFYFCRSWKLQRIPWMERRERRNLSCFTPFLLSCYYATGSVRGQPQNQSQADLWNSLAWARVILLNSSASCWCHCLWHLARSELR